jgi:hypothetical protein
MGAFAPLSIGRVIPDGKFSFFLSFLANYLTFRTRAIAFPGV